jgi:chromosome segregation ATPase
MEGKISTSITESEITTEGKIDTKIGVVEGEIGTLGISMAAIQKEIAGLVIGLRIGSLVELGIIIDCIALNDDVSDLESNVEDLWDTIGNIDYKLDRYEEYITEIHKQIDNLIIPPDFTEDIENINNKLDTFEEDISDLFVKANTQEEDINEINNRLDTFEEDISDINNKLDTFEEDIDEINDWRNNLSIRDYEEDISDKNNKVDTFEEDISDIQTLLDK